MTVADLIRLLPEGIGVLSVVIIVMLFLRYQNGQDTRLNAISTRCHDTQIEIQKGYQESLKSVLENHSAVSESLTARLATLDDSLRALNSSINQMIGKLK